MPQEISSGHHEGGSASPSSDDEGQVKISLAIGKDTLTRLDRIVDRAGFGGRGRALDSLLESLDEVMSYVRKFNKNLSEASEGAGSSKEDPNAFRNAIMAAALAFAKMDRFYGFEGNQESAKPGTTG
jgi:hypothetical protein